MRNSKLHIVYKNIDDLIPYVNNPKQHSEEQIKKIASSIIEFGFKVPIIIDRNNVIIAGHGRYEAAKKIGLKEVPVIIADDLTPAQVKAFRIADNKVTESDWDLESLATELTQLKEFNYDLELTGFDEEEVQSLIDDLAIDDFFEEKPHDSVSEKEDKDTTTVVCPQCGFIFEVEKK